MAEIYDASVFDLDICRLPVYAGRHWNWLLINSWEITEPDNGNRRENKNGRERTVKKHLEYLCSFDKLTGEPEALQAVAYISDVLKNTESPAIQKHFLLI